MAPAVGVVAVLMVEVEKVPVVMVVVVKVPVKRVQ